MHQILKLKQIHHTLKLAHACSANCAPNIESFFGACITISSDRFAIDTKTFKKAAESKTSILLNCF